MFILIVVVLGDHDSPPMILVFLLYMSRLVYAKVKIIENNNFTISIFVDDDPESPSI